MRKQVFILLFLVLAIGIWVWWRHSLPADQVITDEPSATEPNQTGQPTPQARQRQATAVPASAPGIPNPAPQDTVALIDNRINQMKQELEKGQEEWRTPIEFYGKVVDENTNPVANADIRFVWTDLSPQGNSEKQTTSDGNGLFSLSSVTGKHLIVQVSKQGYYAFQPFGAAFFYAGENQNFVPDAANPVVFRLKIKRVAEPLVHIQAPLGGAKGFRIARDGTALEISLATGQAVSLGQGDLRVECQTGDQGKPAGQKYDWKCQISVPNGGLVESTSDLDFQAPMDGYRSADVIDMPAKLESDWSGHASRKYFLKLANGNYARLSFEMIAGGDHFFQVESFLNPSGSRNLEFDPNNVIAVSN